MFKLNKLILKLFFQLDLKPLIMILKNSNQKLQPKMIQLKEINQDMVIGN